LERLDARHGILRALEAVGSMEGGDEVLTGLVPSWEYGRFRLAMAAMRGTGMDKCLSGVDVAARDAERVLRAAPKWLDVTRSELVGTERPLNTHGSTQFGGTGSIGDAGSISTTIGGVLPAGSMHANQITTLIARFDQMRLVSATSLLRELPKASRPTMGGKHAGNTSEPDHQGRLSKRELHPTETIARGADTMVDSLGL